MANSKDFFANAASNGMPLCVTGFAKGGAGPFVSCRLGRFAAGEVHFIITVDEARAIAEAFNAAASFAIPREASAADLGVAEAA